MLVHELRRLSATLIFDLEDVFARRRGARGPHPRPIGPFKVFLVAQMVGDVRQDFPESLEMIIQRNNSGYCLFFGTVKLRDGTLRQSFKLLEGTPRQSYIMRVESQFYQWAERKITLPMTDRQTQKPYRIPVIALHPGYAYPFPTQGVLKDGGGTTLLRGSLHHTDGRGLGGATVAVVGQPLSYRTDETGQWVLVFPDTQQSGNVTARITTPEGTIDVPNVALVRGRETSLPQTALRGWVQTAAGAGIRGATIEVPGHPNLTTSGGDGSWFYYFGLNQADATVDVTARLPNGESLTVEDVLVKRRATVVVPSFRF